MRSDFKEWKGAMQKIETRVQRAAEMAIDEQANELLSKAKTEVPRKTGALKNSAKKESINKSIFEKTKRISFNKIYAAYQHEGQRKDGTRIVKNYTTPGTKKFYIKDTLEKSSGKWVSIVVKNFKNFGF